MPKLAIRITRPYSVIEESGLIDYLRDRSDGLVIAEHSPATETGNVIHCHLYCSSTVGYDAVSARIKALIGSGNEVFSIKTKYSKNGIKQDVDTGAITYMLKGKLEPCLALGVSEDEINFLRLQWKPPKAVADYVFATSADASGNDNTIVQIPMVVKDPILKTQKGQCREIKRRLENYVYDCRCVHCKFERSHGQEVLPVRWAPELIHQNEEIMYLVIHQVLDLADSCFCNKTVVKMAYHVWYVGREFDCPPTFISKMLYIR